MLRKVDANSIALHVQTFTGNTERNGVVKHSLNPAIVARFIRINPQSWHSYIGMRAEFYGCESGNGGYSAWSEWSKCSSTCGSGNRTRSRTCTNPPPSSTGKDCSALGQSLETEACNSGNCAVNGGYSSWGSFGRCSKSCGGGKKTRTRTCTNPKPSNGGKDCSYLGSSYQTRQCKTDPCPINGGYSAWGSFGQCSKTCGGGVKTRTRTCTNPPPSAGGKDCSRLGLSSSTANCNTNECPKDWKAVGCYQNRGRALGEMFAKTGSYSKVAAKVSACQIEANNRGFTVVGVDNRRCWSGQDAENSYDMYGRSGQCKHNQKTDTAAGFYESESIFVYKRKSNGVWEKSGCFSNKSPVNALPDSFGDVSRLSGPDEIYDHCKAKAEQFGYKLFGADDKKCWSGDDAKNTYKKYGYSTLCAFSKKGTGHATGQDLHGNVFVYRLE